MTIPTWQERVSFTGDEMCWKHEWTTAMQDEIDALRAALAQQPSQCVVCGGTGKVEQFTSAAAPTVQMPCFGCKGEKPFFADKNPEAEWIEQCKRDAQPAQGEARACEVFSLGEWCLWPIDRYEEALQRGWPVRKLFVAQATKPAQVPLTDKQIEALFQKHKTDICALPGGSENVPIYRTFLVRMVEAAHGIGAKT